MWSRFVYLQHRNEKEKKKKRHILKNNLKQLLSLMVPQQITLQCLMDGRRVNRLRLGVFVYIVHLVRMYVLIFHSEVIRKMILHALAAQVIQHWGFWHHCGVLETVIRSQYWHGSRSCAFLWLLSEVFWARALHSIHTRQQKLRESLQMTKPWLNEFHIRSKMSDSFPSNQIQPYQISGNH